MIRYASWVAALLIGLSVAGCYTDFGAVVPAENPVERSVVTTSLQPGDRLKVTVYGEENLNGIYDIDSAGNVSLPLAGTLRAAGRGKRELEGEITARYRSEYLQDPKVTVDFVALHPFYMMGEVEHPGEFAYRPGLNLVSAVSMAGGLTYRGSRSSALIRHAGEPVWKEYAILPTVMVAPGDIIRIPERYF
jgi:protein involved in polysaccharide export with SLBB domain